MSITSVCDFLLWCTVINYTVLLAWFAAFVLARERIERLHGRWFRLSGAAFDAVHYGAMGAYKLSVFVLNLVPLVALKIVT